MIRKKVKASLDLKPHKVGKKVVAVAPFKKYGKDRFRKRAEELVNVDTLNI